MESKLRRCESESLVSHEKKKQNIGVDELIELVLRLHLFTDLLGYVKRLLGVEEEIFNLIPVLAQKLQIPDADVVSKDVVQHWEDEDVQLEILLQPWIGTESANAMANLKTLLSDLKEEGKLRDFKHSSHVRSNNKSNTSRAMHLITHGTSPSCSLHHTLKIDLPALRIFQNDRVHLVITGGKSKAKLAK